MTEQVIGGQAFVRIDVPEIKAADKYNGAIAAHTKLFGAGAIYAINPVDEAIATAAASSIRHTPVQAYGLADIIRNMPAEERTRLLASPNTQHQDDVPY